MNQRFGRLTVIEKTDRRISNGCIVWRCKCDCGNICEVSSLNLRKGNTKSCGCLGTEQRSKAMKKTQKIIAERRIENLVGQKFGKLTVLRRCFDDTNKRVSWHCICECGKECDVVAHRLKDGTTKSCGCLVSKGEDKIHFILENLKIKFKQHYYININHHKVYFDFAILNNNNKIIGFIEYDGKQHFKYDNSKKSWNNKENFYKTKYRDAIKDNYCIINKISLYRIPYWDYEKIDNNYIIKILNGRRRYNL